MHVIHESANSRSIAKVTMRQQPKPRRQLRDGILDTLQHLVAIGKTAGQRGNAKSSFDGLTKRNKAIGTKGDLGVRHVFSHPAGNGRISEEFITCEPNIIS